MKQGISILCLIVLAALLVACGKPPEVNQAPTQPSTEGESQEVATAAPEPTEEMRNQLIIAMPNEPDTLDVAVSSWSDMYHDLISQPPVAYSEDLSTVIPDGVESFDVSEDGKTITLHLRKGYKYSNGDPLDAQAFADAWWRYKKESVYKEDLDPIVDMKVIDETTLEVICDQPPAFMWAGLATSYGAPWDIAELKRKGAEEFGRASVASGPFKVVEWVHGSHLTVARNEEYQTSLPFFKNQGPPHLEGIKVRFIEEDLTRVSELAAGTVDIATGIPSSEVARLRENPDIELLEFSVAGMDYLVFNNQRAPFDDVLVRGAMASAVNRDDLIKALNETVNPQYAYLAPSQICYSEEMQQYAKDAHPYNVKDAQTLLADAGWKDTDGDGIVDKDGKPFSVVLLGPSNDPPLNKISVIIQSQLQAVGLNVSIENYDRMRIRDIAEEGDYDLALGDVSWPDPDTLIYRYTDQGPNFSHYKNPEVEEQLTQARYVMDMKERCGIYSQVQHTLIDDVALVPLFSGNNYIGVRKWVDGIFFHKLWSGQIFFNDVTIGVK